MEEFEGRRSGMLNTGVLCNPIKHVVPSVKGVKWGLGTRGLECWQRFRTDSQCLQLRL